MVHPRPSLLTFPPADPAAPPSRFVFRTIFRPRGQCLLQTHAQFSAQPERCTKHSARVGLGAID